MIDTHVHILPGLDDGPATTEESLVMARRALEEGIHTVVATPHVREDWPTTPERVHGGVATLRRALADEGLGLELLPGGEVALDELDRIGENDLRRLTLGGSGRYLLLEFPYVGWPLDIGFRVAAVLRRGFTPVLAHPERNRDVQADPERLQALVDAGALVQLTAPSVDGRLGRRAARTSKVLLDAGLAHLIASDAHAFSGREIGLSRAAAAVGDHALAAWLVETVPRALVTASDLPPRPARRARRRPWRFG